MSASPGRRFREALEQERPLLLTGAVNAVAAMQARRAGMRALYLSGSGVSTVCFGLPDLGMTTRGQVAEEIRRIAGAVDTPLIADADTGFEDEEGGIAETIRAFESAGGAGLHLEDQVPAKRCGHRANKAIVTCEEMVGRLRAAVAAQKDKDFFLIARSDALESEGIDALIARSRKYIEAGADGLFPEALATLEEYRQVCKAVPAPVLANITEFGRTPLFTAAQLAECGVRIVLYPLSAFRAMLAASRRVYETIRSEGNQQAVVGEMMTRADLYDLIDYYKHEAGQDQALMESKR